ncbi:unnamed protein product [Brassica rapa]|uniref:Uncharacterized protein n=1 Tax=Brassica campestris TaxID=3711 RepID=A0A3P6C9F5_BRACM|nr:unnamed protein product [Brassica rapa]VDD15237.1 unnamed protein product [Brassica rapa]
MASSPSSPTLLSFVGIPETSRRMESSWGSRFFSSMNWTRSFIPANIFFNSQMLQVKYTPSRGRSQEQCSNHQSCGPPLNRTLQLSTYCFPNRDVTVYLSLWDEATSTFRGLLKGGDKSQSVVTTVNPKLFGENLYLNSTPGAIVCQQAANGGEENLPSCLEELTEKEFVFQIHVTTFNFTPNHRIFTVPTITEDTILGTHGKGHCENILPSSEVDVRLESSPSGRLFWVRMSGRNLLQQILQRFQPLRTTARAAVRE